MNLGSYKPALRKAIVHAYRSLDALVVLTEQDLATYRRALVGAATRVECIPNGVPAPRLAPSALNARVLIAAGRLEPQKGFDLLLDAFHMVAAKHPDWQLWIFGTGSQWDQLAAQPRSSPTEDPASWSRRRMSRDWRLRYASSSRTRPNAMPWARPRWRIQTFLQCGRGAEVGNAVLGPDRGAVEGPEGIARRPGSKSQAHGRGSLRVGA